MCELEGFTQILNSINGYVWGLPLIVLIMATGIILTVRMKGLQIRRLPLALKYMVKNEEGGNSCGI